MAERRPGSRSAAASAGRRAAAAHGPAAAQQPADGASAGGAAPGGAMPVRAGEDPWTAEELEDLRSDLTGELERLRAEVALLQTSIADVLRDSGDGAGDDQADSGSKAFEREQEMSLLASVRETLFQTERALQRIAVGSYGTCETCGLPIGKLRLQAFPRATLCVACKQRQERR